MTHSRHVFGLSKFIALWLVVFFTSVPVASAEPAAGVVDAASELDGFPDRPEDADKQAWATLKMAVTEAKLVAGDAAADDNFGRSVSLSGNRALVGASSDDDAGSSSGAAYVFELANGSWTQTAKLVAGDAAAFDFFGFSVSLSGDRALVGAYLDDDAGRNSGAAYVFELANGSWTQTAKLVAGDAAAFDFFGFSVSLSGDRALVGAYLDDNAGRDSGSAYVFELGGMGWTQTAKLVADDAAGGDEFGRSVSLSGDRALVGASSDDDAGSSSGAAYVLDLGVAGWTQTAKLVADDAAAFDSFGFSVSLSGDRALVGATDGDAVTATNSGSAYVFDFDGTDWTQTSKLVADDASQGDRFGESVSLSGDRALVGAPEGSTDTVRFSGSAYVFDFNGTGWPQTAKLVAGDAATGDDFGQSVSLSGDRALVGADSDDDAGSNSGSAYVVTAGITAADDAYLVNEGNLLGVSTATGLLANDTGIVPSALEVTLIDGQPVVGVDYAPTGGGTLNVAADGTLSFDTGQDFEALDAGETATVTFSYSISDGFGTDTATVTITVNGRDDTLIAQDDVFTTLEDRAVSGNLFADNGNGIDFGGEADEMLVTTPGTFEADGIGGTVTITETGDFTYTPPADGSGEASFDYTVADTILTDDATVTITVTPINDAPSFVAGPDQTIGSKAPAFQSIEGWASSISVGPNEDDQIVRFRTTTLADTGVLAGDVVITQDGELRYTLTGNTGTAEIEVELRDDGGTDAGGDNTSDSQTFFITVVDNTQVILRRTDTRKWHMYLMNGFTRLSNGNRPFSPNPAWTTRAITDFNGDGVRDLLIRNSANGQWHVYYLNGATGQPDFSRHIGVSNDPDDVFQGAGDLNGDGFGDVLTRSASTGEWQAWYLTGTGDLAFTQPLAITTDANVETQALGDFDGNGTAALLLRDISDGSWTTVGFALGSGGVETSRPQVITRNVLWQPQGIGDFDGNGRDELLLRRTDDNRWLTYGFDATGTVADFGRVFLSPRPEWTLQWIDDFDGDGNDDALLRRTDNNVWNLYLLGPNRQILDSGRVPLTPNGVWVSQEQ